MGARQLPVFEQSPTPGGLPEGAPQPELVFDENGSLPNEHMMTNYGMTSEEGQQYVEFGSWKGTVAQMLSDPRCPVGATVREAHATEGIEGVQKAFEGLKMMAPKVDLVVSAKAVTDYERHGALAPKKKVI